MISVRDKISHVEAMRRSLEGEVQEVSEGVQFEMLSKCRIFVSVASRQYFLTIVTNVALYVLLPDDIMCPCLISLLLVRVVG